jgi:predicted RNA-binding Zn ribbon-like protein
VQEHRWQPIGGHVALDLCNTVSWRRDPARIVDNLDSPERLADWWAEVGLPGLSEKPARGGGVQAVQVEAVQVEAVGGRPLSAGAQGRDVRADAMAGEARNAEERALKRIRALREATHEVVQAHLAKQPAPPSQLERLLEAVRKAQRTARPSPTLPLTWETTDLEAALALAVADLLTDEASTRRISECAADGCGWVFLDTSRNHSRRWCDPEDCGNRARVRAYVNRKKNS